MATQFSESLGTQNLDLHTAALTQLGFGALVDYSGDARKLHDLFDKRIGAWVECKSDQSNYTQRLLVEIKANVPESVVAHLPFRQPIRHGELAAFVASLSSRYDGLGVDRVNLEPGGHYLSYLWVKTGGHLCVDLAALQRTVAGGGYDWLITGCPADPWRSICQIVPVADCCPVDFAGDWYFYYNQSNASDQPDGHWN